MFFRSRRKRKAIRKFPLHRLGLKHGSTDWRSNVSLSAAVADGVFFSDSSVSIVTTLGETFSVRSGCDNTRVGRVSDSEYPECQ